jgi:hypothetical protein
MISLLFWNVGRLSRHTLIARLARANDVDVILLAEVADEPIDLLKELNKTQANYFFSPGIGNTKILAFTKFPDQFFRPCAETDRLTIRRLALPGLEEILLAVVHFPSKLHWSERSQADEPLVKDSGVPDRDVGSDHLPVLFRLNLRMAA